MSNVILILAWLCVVAGSYIAGRTNGIRTTESRMTRKYVLFDLYERLYYCTREYFRIARCYNDAVAHDWHGKDIKQIIEEIEKQ